MPISCSAEQNPVEQIDLWITQGLSGDQIFNEICRETAAGQEKWASFVAGLPKQAAGNPTLFPGGVGPRLFPGGPDSDFLPDAASKMLPLLGAGASAGQAMGRTVASNVPKIGPQLAKEAPGMVRDAFLNTAAPAIGASGAVPAIGRTIAGAVPAAGRMLRSGVGHAAAGVAMAAGADAYSRGTAGGADAAQLPPSPELPDAVDSPEAPSSPTQPPAAEATPPAAPPLPLPLLQPRRQQPRSRRPGRSSRASTKSMRCPRRKRHRWCSRGRHWRPRSLAPLQSSRKL